MNDERKNIRPLYRELQGYLTQAPVVEKTPYLYEPAEWEHFNTAIDLLNAATGKNYDRFKVVPEGGRDSVSTATYRANLGGLIDYLYGEYFAEEAAPFSGSPSTVITQSQSQQQSVSVLLLDIQKKITSGLATTKDEGERSFLQKFEQILPTITNAAQLVKTVLDLCSQMGLDPQKISSFFK